MNRTTTPLTEPLLQGSEYQERLQRQLDLEMEAVQAGRNRYRQLIEDAMLRGDGPSLKPADRYRRFWLPPLTEAIREEQRGCAEGESATGRGTYGPVMLHPQFLEHPEVLALVTINNAMSWCMLHMRGVLRREVSYAIGREVLALLDYEAIVEDDPTAAVKLHNSMRKLSPQYVRWWRRSKGGIDHHFTQRKLIYQVGECLLARLMGCASATGESEGFKLAFHYYTTTTMKNGRPRAKSMLRMDESVFEKLEDGHQQREALHPKHLPMIVSPFPWQIHDDGLVEGGYAKVRVPLIIKMRKSHREMLKGKDISRVLAGVGAVSEQPWRVNSRVHEVVKKFYEQGGGVLGLPRSGDYPRPPHPIGFDPGKKGLEAWDGVSELDRRLWKREAAETHERNIHLKGLRSEMEYRLRVTERFAREERFWLPHQCDFRGRCYVTPTGLNYQGDDVMRGLLEFADGRTTDADGDRSLMIHAANCYGIDKVSFDERVKWVSDHYTDIAKTTADPMKCEFWQHADKPWQFLAACFALADGGDNLPTQWDGSCNGLQHYAALGRDADTAALVNMVPAEKPSDIYTAVAASVIMAVDAQRLDPRMCETEYTTWHKGQRVTMSARQIAEMLEGKIRRSVVKQPVMTTVYGVTHIGAREQMYGSLLEVGLTEVQAQLASRYLTKVVKKAIGERCDSADRIMSWLRSCARIISKDKKGKGCQQTVRWTSPVGFPVEQAYRNAVKIITPFGDLDISGTDSNAKPRTYKQINACAPSYVHSVDASHMMMTALAAKDEGLAFAAVHDSYWTHAQDARDLGQIIREEFVLLHSRDLLGELHDEWTKVYGVEFPEPPQRGDYDITQVLQSPYFFS